MAQGIRIKSEFVDYSMGESIICVSSTDGGCPYTKCTDPTSCPDYKPAKH